MLRQRVLSSVVIVPIVFAAIWFGDPWFTILLSVVALLAAVEFYSLPGRGKWHPLTVFGAIWAVFFVLNAHSRSPATTPMLVTSAVALSLLCSLLPTRRGEKAFVSWSWALAGMFYAGWLLSFWVLLMNSYGRDWVYLAIFSTFAVDTSAYFVGRAVGKHKMAPRVSPSKTWEGAVGGLAAGIAAVIVLALILGLDVSYWKLALIGFLVSLSAQLGDLAESRLKRSTGVKESGTLIPGHGGILDRVDSVVFTGVVVYYCLIWLVG